MPSDFIVGGPVEVVAEGSGRNKFITAACKRSFLGSEEFAAYANKQGVYVFALKGGRGHTPWYVGKTNGQHGMLQECMTDNKVNKYNEAMRLSNGTPVLFFVVPPGNRRVVAKPVVKDMERQLTQDALAKNPRLLNVQNTRNLPEWSIKGVIRSNVGRPTRVETDFRRTMGL